MDAIDTIALTMGIAWASGINLYAAVLTLGLLGATGNMTLPPGLEILTNPAVLWAAGIMYMIEFFADKIPGLDTLWDSIHTFIRIPAAAVLAARAVGEVDPAVALAAGLLGGTLAAGSHLTKAGTRALINASPEPFTNIAASVGEDALVVAGLWTAVSHPLVFLIGLLVFVGLVIWLLPKIWRAVMRMLRAIGRFVRGERAVTELPEAPPDTP